MLGGVTPLLSMRRLVGAVTTHVGSVDDVFMSGGIPLALT